MVNKWEIFFCDLSPVIGSEQKGMRPVLIVSSDAINHHLEVSTVLPLSSFKEGSRIFPSEVLLGAKETGLSKDSITMMHQVRTISHERFINKAGILKDEPLRKKIEAALSAYFEI